MARLTVRIPKGLRTELGRFCRRAHLSLNSVVCDALRQYTTRERHRPVHERFSQKVEDHYWSTKGQKAFEEFERSERKAIPWARIKRKLDL